MTGIRRYTALLLLLTGLFTSSTGVAQKKIISGIVKDSHSDERIPFASVSFKRSTIGKLTDSSGTFTFYLNNWPSDTLEITCVGYQPFFYIINQNKDSISTNILMERGTFNEGVRIRVKVNKGLLVWKKDRSQQTR